MKSQDNFGAALYFGFGTCGISAIAMDGVTQNKSSARNWRQLYRELSERHNRFTSRYSQVMQEKQQFKQRAYDLNAELITIRPEVAKTYRTIDRLEQRIEKLEAQNHDLRKQLAAVKDKLDIQPRKIPDFVKPNVAEKKRKRPGRKDGHEAANRPIPKKIDQHVEVPLPKDDTGVCCCPHCNTQLSDVKGHDRIVEDIVPSKPVTSCYHTGSGYCPNCRKRIETRAAEQPPAANVPHGQVGLNTLAMAAIMRAVYRMPYELITQLMSDLPGISISKGALAQQIVRMGDLLEGEYDRLKVLLHFSPVVHMDETSWRVDGKNCWLWGMMDATHTVFHVDKSRGSKVVIKLLGEVFGGTLVTDFYSAYNLISCRKQKCLVHLLRDIRDTSARNPVFAKSDFARRLKRLIKQMLLLKKQKSEMEISVYQEKGRRLEQRLEELSKQTWSEADAHRLCKRLRRHAGELTLFLWEEVDATNNAMERVIRTAVILRKITGGSRSQRGARATAILLSIVRTIRQQNLPMFETFKQLLKAAWANQPPGILTDQKPQPTSAGK